MPVFFQWFRNRTQANEKINQLYDIAEIPEDERKVLNKAFIAAINTYIEKGYEHPIQPAFEDMFEMIFHVHIRKDRSSLLFRSCNTE